jgi:hypothetical protein
MHCPHQGCAVPPCQIVPHPNRKDIEYCRVCEKSRNINEIGSDVPGVFWSIVAIAVTLTLFINLTNDSQKMRYREQEYSPSRRVGQISG